MREKRKLIMAVTQWAIEQLPWRLARFREARLWRDMAMGLVLPITLDDDVALLSAIHIAVDALCDHAAAWSPMTFDSRIEPRPDADIASEIIMDYGDYDPTENRTAIAAQTCVINVANQPCDVTHEIEERICGCMVHATLIRQWVALDGSVYVEYAVAEADSFDDPEAEFASDIPDTRDPQATIRRIN